MLSHLVIFIQAFLPVALMSGMLLALDRPDNGKKKIRLVIFSLAVGLLAGGIAYFVSLRMETATAARTALQGAAIVGALINASALLLSRKDSGLGSIASVAAALTFPATLAAASAFGFFAQSAEQALSTTAVLNTELILNIAGIVTGVALIIALFPLTSHLGFRNGRLILSTLMLVASLLLAMRWGADLMLGLMRLEMVEVTSPRLSFVAKVTKYSYLVPYLCALIIGVLAFVFFARKPAVSPHDPSVMPKAEWRKAKSLVMFEMRWFKAALGCVALIFIVLLYHDLYASRPPKITPPTKITPDAQRLVKIKIAAVNDGNLHRYAMITDDGHVVRFFLINKAAAGQNRIGVVYDACMLCGDMGYIKEKNEVICIACNVRIFPPSIGKAGGCNPIPLPHTVEGDTIVITAEEIDKGARYFSEVASIQVKDPISGAELNNLKAQHRYEYKGRIYFFESEANAEKFKASPETYVPDVSNRPYRVEGFRNS